MKGALRARVGFGFDDAAVGFLAASCVACGSRRTAGTSPRAATGPRRYTTSRRVGRCGERPSPPHFDIYSRVRSAEMSCCGGGAGSVLFHEAEKKDMYIRSLCFSPGGKFLATGAEDGRIRVRRPSCVHMLALTFFFFFFFLIYGILGKNGFCTCTRDTGKMCIRSTFRSMGGSSCPVRGIRQ